MKEVSPRGRPGVTYEDVSAAAAQLRAKGVRPSVRRVRDILGVGSLDLILRHLKRWRSSRLIAQTRSPFAISSTDIAMLSPVDFAAVINHLVRVEIRKNGIAANPDISLRINDGDGGIDGAIKWTGRPHRTVHLPSRNVAWQTKSGERLAPSGMAREVQSKDGSRLKSGVKSILAAGGTYVLFSAADMTATQKAASINAIIDVVNKHLPDCEPSIDIVAGEELAAWAAEDLWTRSLLIKIAGRENPALLATFQEWEQQRRLTNEYVWSSHAEKIAQDIRVQVQRPGTVFRVDGPPGLGKTRLVMEALRPFIGDGIGVVYFSARHPGSGLDLLRALPTWKRLKTSGILVVDDCDAQLHQDILQIVPGSDLAVVTIDYHHDTPSDATLRITTDEVIEQIVRAYGGFPPRHNAGAEIARIVGYAQGWPLMAILVLEAAAAEKAHIADLDDDQLTARLAENTEDADASAVLKVMSLFDHVGHRDDVADEWEVLRTVLLPEVSRNRFHKIIRSYERRGLVVNIGRYWRVTPPPLAIRLTREWLEETPPELHDSLFRDLSPALMQSFARRFDDISTPTAQELADRLLAPSARFGTLRGISGRPNIDIFRALAAVNPEAAVATLRRIFLPLSDAQLLEIDDIAGRQDLVFALEGIAFHRKHFADAARILFALARNENATNSNNATGTLTKLFGIVGSQTEASLEERLCVLSQFASVEDVRSRDILVGILRLMLSRDMAIVRSGPEFQGGRPPMVEWRPATWEEVFNYYTAAVTHSLKLAHRDDDGMARAKLVIAHAIPALTYYKRWDDLERALKMLSTDAWPEAVEKLLWARRHAVDGTETVDIGRLERALALLAPQTLEDRIKIFVSEPPRDLELRNGVAIDVSLERLEEFAAETIASGSVRQVLDVLSSGLSHRLPHGYGQAVARKSGDLEQLARDALAAYEDAPEPRNDLALMSIVGTIGESNPALRQAILDRIIQDERLVEALPALTIWPPATTLDAERLTNAYLDNRLRTPPRHNIFYGKSFARVDGETVRKLADVFIQREWYSSAVQLLEFAVETPEHFDDVFARLILAADFVQSRMEDIHEWSVLEICKRLTRNGHDSFVLELTKRMIDLATSNASFSAKRRVANLWPELIVRSDVWRILLARYADSNKADRWKLLSGLLYVPPQSVEHRSALEDIPIPQLLSFATTFEDDVPWYLAENCSMLERIRDGKLPPFDEGTLVPSQLMLDLLERFGQRDDVLRSLTSSLHSFLSAGPRAIYYERRSKVIDDIPTFNNTKVAAWKEDLRAQLAGERRRAQAHDEEFREGIF